MISTKRTVSDKVSRQRQIAKFVRLILVHRRMRVWYAKNKLTTARVDKLARRMGVSSRTIWRDWKTLVTCYEELGSTSLDHADDD